MKKTYRVEGLDCAHCAAKVESAVQKLEGVQSATLNFIAQKLTIEAQESDFKAIEQRMRRTVKKLEPECKICSEDEKAGMEQSQKKVLWRIIAAAVLCVVAYLLPLTGIWRLMAFLVPYLIVGAGVLWNALKNIARGQIFDEKFLMAVATLGAFAIGEYPEAVAVMVFYQVGELFEGVALGRSRRSIASLMDIRPDSAAVLRDGREVTVSPEEVAADEIMLVRPGERVALDGEIIEGSTTLNTSALTGESVPVDAAVGDKVISGSINLTGVIKVRTQCSYEQSTVAKILELVENSAEKKAKAESFITRFARYYTPCVVIGAVLLALLPPLVWSQPWSEWINRALIFLVVSCPCALVVSVPLTFFGGIGRASRDGILIKGSNYLEQLAEVDTVVFDKTGTLTKGVFEVESINAESLSENDLLEVAAAIESYSEHPVAQSVRSAYKGSIDLARIADVTEIAGKGVTAVVDGKKCYAGNGALMELAGVQWKESTQSGTIIHIACDGEYLGNIVISDSVKTDAAAAIAELKRLGVSKTVMLTGDNARTAQQIAQKLGIDEVKAELLPAQKVEALEAMLTEKSRTAFVGDGINDAPVLSRADIGVAMGAMGSDAAIESADIVLMDDKPSKLSLAIKIAAKTKSIAKQNIALALGVKAVILLLGALGIANMWIAVFGDVGVLVLATLNAMRMMGKKVQ